MTHYTFTIDTSPTGEGRYPYLWRVTDTETAEVLDGGGSEVASEDSDEWARQADVYVAASGWRRTGPWAAGTDGEVSAPIVRADAAPERPPAARAVELLRDVAETLDATNLEPVGLSWTRGVGSVSPEFTVHMDTADGVRRAARALDPQGTPVARQGDVAAILLMLDVSFCGTRVRVYGPWR